MEAGPSSWEKEKGGLVTSYKTGGRGVGIRGGEAGPHNVCIGGRLPADGGETVNQAVGPGRAAKGQEHRGGMLLTLNP